MFTYGCLFFYLALWMAALVLFSLYIWVFPNSVSLSFDRISKMCRQKQFYKIEETLYTAGLFFLICQSILICSIHLLFLFSLQNWFSFFNITDPVVCNDKFYRNITSTLRYSRGYVQNWTAQAAKIFILCNFSYRCSVQVYRQEHPIFCYLLKKNLLVFTKTHLCV